MLLVCCYDDERRRWLICLLGHNTCRALMPSSSWIRGSDHTNTPAAQRHNSQRSTTHTQDTNAPKKEPRKKDTTTRRATGVGAIRSKTATHSKNNKTQRKRNTKNRKHSCCAAHCAAAVDPKPRWMDGWMEPEKAHGLLSFKLFLLIARGIILPQPAAACGFPFDCTGLLLFSTNNKKKPPRTCPGTCYSPEFWTPFALVAAFASQHNRASWNFAEMRYHRFRGVTRPKPGGYSPSTCVLLANVGMEALHQTHTTTLATGKW